MDTNVLLECLQQRAGLTAGQRPADPFHVGLKPRPKTQFRTELRRSLDAVRARLATDPAFLDGYGNDVDRFASMITAPKIKSVIDFLSIFIAGARGMVIPSEFDSHLKEDTYMYAALKVLRECAFELEPTLRRDTASMKPGQGAIGRSDIHVKGDLTLGDGATLVVLGDLVVGGNLHLGAQAIVVTRGSVEVAGHLFAPAWYSRLAAGRSIAFSSGLVEGELIAADGIKVNGALVLRGNDVSCRASTLAGETVIVKDKYSRFAAIEVANYIEFGTTTDAAELVDSLFPALAASDDWDEAFLERLAGSA